MPFKEKGLVTFKTVNGKLQEEVESETIITVTNKITKQEYGSDAEATADVNDPQYYNQKGGYKKGRLDRH